MLLVVAVLAAVMRQVAVEVVVLQSRQLPFLRGKLPQSQLVPGAQVRLVVPRAMEDLLLLCSMGQRLLAAVVMVR
jgi:rhodanese-related sulfurtransferase